MRSASRTAAKFLAGIWALGIFIAGFLAYFTLSKDPATGLWHDGLGRTLYETPLLVRFVFGQERLYPGFLWFVFDSVAFFGSLAGALALFNWAEGGSASTLTPLPTNRRQNLDVSNPSERLDIIGDYGAVLEKMAPYSAARESDLPYSKDLIGAAIFMELEERGAALDENTRNSLCNAYLSLADFVADYDFEVVQEYEDMLHGATTRASGNTEGARPDSLASRLATGLGEKYVALQKHSTEAQRQRLDELRSAGLI